ncbi:uncharacterized protein [Spinacia oleracea]|uniref:Uncharacterized protein n=1 Tax=Spinacia oleracea TaxID=3562 RepID=A0ABM3R3Z7_SPIOL|nr:uncharacterized protein LOC110798472 [Spinacia oleracea]
MDVRDEIDMNKLGNPTKSKNTGRSSKEPKIGTEKQSYMTETGQYKIENEIETEKQIDTVHDRDGKTSSTSETEVQKTLSEVDQEGPSKSLGQHVSETTFSKEHKAEQQKKDCRKGSRNCCKGQQEAEERIATPAIAARIEAEKRAPAADAEAKRVAEEKHASATDAEAKRVVEEKASAAEAEAKRQTEEKASVADAEARRVAEEKASAAEAEAKRQAEKKVVENVNVSESEDQTNGGNGTKRGRKTTTSKKKTIQNITIDEALQKKLHSISDSYNPRRNTRSMVKVQENVCAEIVSKEEFEGKDVSEVTSKVTNTPKKRKGAEKEDEDEPVDVEIIKTKKQKGVEKKASVKGRILPLRTAMKRNKKNDIEEVRNEQKKEQTVPVKDRLLMFEKQRQKIASKRTTPKANLPAEKKRKRKITDEDYEVKEENGNDDIHNSENALIVEREVSPLAIITKEVPARKKAKKTIAIFKEKVEEEEEEEEKTGVRGGHGKFITFISMMNEQKKEAVRNIGLGPLLDFQLPTLSQFVTWLCNNFEENSQYLYPPKNEKILIEFEDVKKIYGLPRGEVDIVEA